jgi:LmbE family N-acetylglucosaminyl deacetylase
MALSGILECFQRDDQWFCGVVVTNGSVSPREELYKNYTDDEMRAVRRKEQKKAAIVDEYSALVQLDYPSSAVKGGNIAAVTGDLIKLFEAAQLEVVYTHNLADKHDTHVGVALRVIELSAGRRRTNATYFEPHRTDIVSEMIYVNDLTPLTKDLDKTPRTFLTGFTERFSEDIVDRLVRLQGNAS